MSPRVRALAAGLAVAAITAPQALLAHAALLDAELAQAVRLQAQYDTGAPMAGAQVIIYAPDDPARPWKRGATDAEGRFVFLPDGRPGQWSVQVRQAGHGAIAHLLLGEAPPQPLTEAPGGMSVLERVVAIALVAWGALGTALFALRRRGQADASS